MTYTMVMTAIAHASGLAACDIYTSMPRAKLKSEPNGYTSSTAAHKTVQHHALHQDMHMYTISCTCGEQITKDCMLNQILFGSARMRREQYPHTNAPPLLAASNMHAVLLQSSTTHAAHPSREVGPWSSTSSSVDA